MQRNSGQLHGERMSGDFSGLAVVVEAQFKAKGGGYLYRRNCKGAPVLVTAEQRRKLVAMFRRRCRLAGRWSLAGAGLALVLILAGRRGPPELLFAPAAVLMAAMLLPPFYVLWAWNAPARALRRRRT